MTEGEQAGSSGTKRSFAATAAWLAIWLVSCAPVRSPESERAPADSWQSAKGDGAPKAALEKKPSEAGESRATNVSAHPKNAGELFPKGLSPIETGWEDSPKRLRHSECAKCHQKSHAEWSQSMHALAWSDPLFQEAYAQESQAWCRNCHAPLLVQEKRQVPREEGISCAACHVRGGEIIGARALSPSESPHRVTALVGFAEPELCAGCHQFNFPREGSRALSHPDFYSDEPMQNTIEEWRASRKSSCSTCHGGGHLWVGPHDEEWLSGKFLQGSLSEIEEDLLSLRIELSERGHGMPTGDLFRSLVLEIATDEAFQQILLRKRYGKEFDGSFTSNFSFLKGGTSRDTRIAAQKEALTLTFDRPQAQVLFVRLRYFFNDPWVHGKWTPDERSARIVWSQSFSLADSN